MSFEITSIEGSHDFTYTVDPDGRIRIKFADGSESPPSGFSVCVSGFGTLQINDKRMTLPIRWSVRTLG